MKDSARRILDTGVALALAAGVLTTAGCAREKKAEDVAQDSILVKDADMSARKADTTVPGTTLVRDRGSVPQTPVLTTGAPVKRSPDVKASGGLQPPKRVNPTPVLPGRDSFVERRVPQRPIGDPIVDPSVPPPVTQPIIRQPPVPQPQPVTQPTLKPKRDSSTDSLSAAYRRSP